jgi:hypothetical protein
MNEEDSKQLVLSLVGTALSLLAVYLASDPEAPARWYYRLKLWLAYRNPEPNQPRLERLRDLYRAGAYQADARPTATTLRNLDELVS